jgi:hypothetical protein
MVYQRTSPAWTVGWDEASLPRRETSNSWFYERQLRAGGAEPTQHIPTPDTLIYLLCDFVQKFLSAPVSAKSLSLARNALSNVCVATLYDIAPDYNGRYGMERSPAGI